MTVLHVREKVELNLESETERTGAKLNFASSSLGCPLFQTSAFHPLPLSERLRRGGSER